MEPEAPSGDAAQPERLASVTSYFQPAERPVMVSFWPPLSLCVYVPLGSKAIEKFVSPWTLPEASVTVPVTVLPLASGMLTVKSKSWLA